MTVSKTNPSKAVGALDGVAPGSKVGASVVDDVGDDVVGAEVDPADGDGVSSLVGFAVGWVVVSAVSATSSVGSGDDAVTGAMVGAAGMAAVGAGGGVSSLTASEGHVKMWEA